MAAIGSLRAVAVIVLSGIFTVAKGIADTPPLGWNSWNHFGCSVNSSILTSMASAMAKNFKSAGYTYINSDDCWMLANRTADGDLIANPTKFPEGFEVVATFIHNLGLKSGLYTARGPNTCAGFAASCGHEAQDARLWASWGIDYVKDDACSPCGSLTDDTLYHTMWSGIQESGRAMVLSVEGTPDVALLSAGGLGNAHRVGHDISPLWGSMLSLIDVGSGLWPYAHNSTNATFGGFWNDLDMIEVGNAPDFLCPQDAESLIRCQTHFTFWSLLKSPLILGNNLAAVDATTLAILVNAEAIAVNQDPLGVQARRVAVFPPSNSTIGGPRDTIAVVAPCDSARPTQRWHFQNMSAPSRNQLHTVPCEPGDPWQQWDFVAGPDGASTLVNRAAGLCVDAHAQFNPVLALPCTPKTKSQIWSLNVTSGQVVSSAGYESFCLNLDGLEGTFVDVSACDAPGHVGANQEWTLTSAAQLSPASAPMSCLTLVTGPSSGVLYTNTSDGTGFCLANTNGVEGTWVGLTCGSAKVVTLTPNPVIPNTTADTPHVAATAAIAATTANYTLSQLGGTVEVNNQTGSSGPWPHTRYVKLLGTQDGQGPAWTMDLVAAAPRGAGTAIVTASGPLIDDDLVGGVGLTVNQCLDLQTSGMLEVWAGQLMSGRIAVALFNRSPSPDSITATWAAIGATPGAPYAVRDIWAGVDRGVFTGTYTAVSLPSHAAVFLVLIPQ